MSNRIYAIGDIHGRLDLLDEVLNKLYNEENLDLNNDKLIFLGDYVDRGTNSKGVLDTVRTLTETYPNNVIALAGNHEWLMIDGCLRSYDDFYLWTINGGDATLLSFTPSQKVPDDYIRWVASLPLYHEEPGFFFSHSPAPAEPYRNIIRRDQPYDKNELTWTRTRNVKDEQMMSKYFGNGIVGVCGHNHALNYLPKLYEPRFYDHYIFADAGCGCSSKAPLVAIEVISRKTIYAWPAEAMETHS